MFRIKYHDHDRTLGRKNGKYIFNSSLCQWCSHVRLFALRINSLTLSKKSENIRISVNRKLLGLLASTTIFFITYTSYSDSPTLLQVPYFKDSCSPADYSDGEWVYSPHTSKSNMTESEDALRFSGFSGCASSREFLWHLAAGEQESLK